MNATENGGALALEPEDMMDETECKLYKGQADSSKADELMRIAEVLGLSLISSSVLVVIASTFKKSSEREHDGYSHDCTVYSPTRPIQRLYI